MRKMQYGSATSVLYLSLQFSSQFSDTQSPATIIYLQTFLLLSNTDFTFVLSLFTESQNHRITE